MAVGKARPEEGPRSNDERKHCLSNLPSDTPIKDVAKTRWTCEQAHHSRKNSVRPLEGRSCTSHHRLR